MKFKISLFLLLLIVPCILSQSREVVRIATYNLLNYPDSYSIRNPEFKKVVDEINPDILVVQEVVNFFGAYTFLTEVLDTSEFVAGPFIPGPDTQNAIFYKDSVLTLISHITIATSLRNISEFTIYHNLTLDTLKIYSVHLKASDGSTNEQQRLAEVTVLRDITDNLPQGTDFLVLGDFNIYYSGEPAYQKLIEQTNSGYVIDPLPAGNWHNNSAFKDYHTQSTCGLLSGCPNGGSGGGLDDRFDMILISQAVSDSGGITLIEPSYTAFGNDGEHFNLSINVPPFNIISQEIANALYNSSDHLPVFADFDFGSVSSVNEFNSTITMFTLYQNYPNPFNPTTTIRFELPKANYVRLLLYDVLGREVKTIYDGEALSGLNEVELNTENLTSGVYFYSLLYGDNLATKKLTILK